MIDRTKNVKDVRVKVVTKKLYFGTNLKMYKTIADTMLYLQKLSENTKNISRDEIELFVIPSYTSLPVAIACVDRGYIKLGAQNMYMPILYVPIPRPV